MLGRGFQEGVLKKNGCELHVQVFALRQLLRPTNMGRNMHKKDRAVSDPALLFDNLNTEILVQ
jgi:hypothetical protein